jgi:hypothetical protein
MRRVLAMLVACEGVAAIACASLRSPSDKPASGDDGAADASDEDDGGDDADARDDAPPGWPACPTITSGASVFVIDSTQKLFAFDASGSPMGSVALPTPIGDINGGGIAVASASLYVTVGQPTNAVAAYGLDLAPRSLDGGSFAALEVPRGIAFDCHDGLLFAANGGTDDSGLGVGVYAFTPAGVRQPIGGDFQPYYGPSGVAFDPDDRAIWVANYVGSPSTSFGVGEYTVGGKPVKTFDYRTQFTGPRAHEEPYSVAVCSGAATGTSTLVVVGFIADTSGLGHADVQAFTVDGMPSGAPLKGSFVKPYGVSCDSHGRVYVADRTGLHVEDLGAANDAGPVGPFPGLRPPIYGVLAAE